MPVYEESNHHDKSEIDTFVEGVKKSKCFHFSSLRNYLTMKSDKTHVYTQFKAISHFTCTKRCIRRNTV